MNGNWKSIFLIVEPVCVVIIIVCIGYRKKFWQRCLSINEKCKTPLPAAFSTNQINVFPNIQIIQDLYYINFIIITVIHLLDSVPMSVIKVIWHSVMRTKYWYLKNMLGIVYCFRWIFCSSFIEYTKSYLIFLINSDITWQLMHL